MSSIKDKFGRVIAAIGSFIPHRDYRAELNMMFAKRAAIEGALTLVDNAGWKMLSASLEERIRMIGDEIDAKVAQDCLHEVPILTGERKALRDALRYPETLQRTIAELDAEIASLQEQLGLSDATSITGR